MGSAGPGDSAGSIPDPAEASPIAGQRTVQEVIEETDIGAEVQEAAELDDVAREHFLERRTRQLHGQGKTTRVARSLAEAEWRSRGSNDAA